MTRVFTMNSAALHVSLRLHIPYLHPFFAVAALNTGLRNEITKWTLNWVKTILKPNLIALAVLWRSILIYTVFDFLFFPFYIKIKVNEKCIELLYISISIQLFISKLIKKNNETMSFRMCKTQIMIIIIIKKISSVFFFIFKTLQN